MPSPGPLEIIFEDIERAIRAELFYVAVAVTLSLPDICAGLISPQTDPFTNGKKYKAWCDENLAKRFTQLTSDDIYRLRCGVLHQGKFGHPQARFDRAMFVLPDRDRLMATGFMRNVGVEGTLLAIDLVDFCRQIIEAARFWYEKVKDHPNVVMNVPYLVRNRPEGFGGIRGLAVIA